MYTHLRAKVPSIHVISKKQVIPLFRATTDFEQPDQVVELTVNVAANYDRTEAHHS